MDESVLRAMARWPDVPAVFGWLSLDRRGRWRIRGEPITNRAAVGFIGRNYLGDATGRWYFQNGPQRVFVQLAATPWVVRLEPGPRFTTHTGAAAGVVRGVFLDEHGALTLATELGPALLDDRDLDAFSERLRGAAGEVLDEESIIDRIEDLRRGEGGALGALLADGLTPVSFLGADDQPRQLGFVRDPRPDDGPDQKA